MMAKQPQTRTKPANSSAEPTPERVSMTTAPKPRHDVGLAWLVLLGLLILASLPLIIHLNTPGIWSEQEAYSVAISAETFQRKAPINDAETSLQSWTPVYQGESRWDLPPGATWLHMVMYTGLPTDWADPMNTSNATWTGRARLGSLLIALVFIAAVFWAGYSIGGLMPGTIAAFVAMTMPLVIGFGRHANPHIVAMAWSSLSIAGALWAMRPLRAAPSLVRQLIGWIVCGVGLGLAALTLGPTAIPGTLICTIVLAMICPRRIGHIMGLLASTALAALLLMPWALHVHGHDPDVWQQWLSQLKPDFGQAGLGAIMQRAGLRILLAALLTGLWLIWLIPAITQPFSTSTGTARRKLLLGWGWLITATLLFALAPAAPDRPVLPGLLMGIAPFCVAIALIIQQFHDLSAEGRHARFWHLGKWVSCASMLALAVVLPLLGFLISHQPDTVQWLPSMEQSLFAKMHWSYYAGATLALLLASVLATRFAVHDHPGRTIASLAAWLLILYGLAAIPISMSDRLNTTQDTPPTIERSARF